VFLSIEEFFNHLRLVNEADDAPFESPQSGELVEPHLSLRFGTNKRVYFTNFSHEVGNREDSENAHHKSRQARRRCGSGSRSVGDRVDLGRASAAAAGSDHAALDTAIACG